jgi:Bacteriophage probable baseplate hub protein
MSAAGAYPVRSPQWILTYAGVNITADVSQMVLSISYVDRVGGASGEVEVELEDHAMRWQGPWYPALGDGLNLLIGYSGDPLLPCGDFQVDDLELGGPPDVFRMRCLAAYVTPAMRTCYSVGYENQSLLAIAGAVAGKYGLEMVATSGVPDIVFERVTQHYETDLAFLRRLANEYDYDFTVRGLQLVFYARAALEAQAPVATVERSQVSEFQFRNRTRRIFRAAEVSYLLPRTKTLISRSAEALLVAPTGDTVKLVTRCENQTQAALRAQAALRLNNRDFKRARLVMPGATVLSAGSNVALSGFGAFDGLYLIEAARHRLSRMHGYTTEVEVRNVA